MTTERKPKPKLPKVWVLLTPRVDLRDGFRLDACMQDRASLAALRREWQGLYAYAPVKKPRRCVWTAFKWRDVTACGDVVHDVVRSNFVVCPYCGGEIRRKK